MGCCVHSTRLRNSKDQVTFGILLTERNVCMTDYVISFHFLIIQLHIIVTCMLTNNYYSALYSIAHFNYTLHSSILSYCWLKCTAAATATTTTTSVQRPLFQDNLGSRYQKGKTSLDLKEARDGEVLGCSVISCSICKTICTSLQTDNHINT